MKYAVFSLVSNVYTMGNCCGKAVSDETPLLSTVGIVVGIIPIPSWNGTHTFRIHGICLNITGHKFAEAIANKMEESINYTCDVQVTEILFAGMSIKNDTSLLDSGLSHDVHASVMIYYTRTEKSS